MDAIVEQVKQVFRTALANPYDVIAPKVESEKDFTRKVEEYYSSFPQQKFLLWTKNPLMLKGLAERIKDKTSVEQIVDRDTDFWERLKIFETLVRTGEVGKNGELLKIADVLSVELRMRLETLNEQLRKIDKDDTESREKILKEIRETQRLEKGLWEILDTRRQKVKTIQSLLSQKDKTLEEILDAVSVEKVIKPLEERAKTNPFAALAASGILESLHRFATETMEEFRENPPQKFIEDLRATLKGDKRFKTFLDSIEGAREKSAILNSARHLIFFYKLLEAEDTIFKTLERQTAEFLKNVANSIKELKLNLREEDKRLVEEWLNEIPSSTIEEGLEKLKRVREILAASPSPNNEAVLRLIDKLLEFERSYEDFKRIREEGKSVFLSEYRAGLFEAIEKFYNYSRGTHEKLLKELVSLHNLDLLLWKLHKRQITPVQLENFLKTSELSVGLSPKVKETLKKFFEVQLKAGVRPYKYYLDPIEYSRVIKNVLFKQYGYDLYKDLYLTFQPMGVKELINPLKLFGGVEVWGRTKRTMEENLLRAKERDLNFTHRMVVRSGLMLVTGGEKLLAPLGVKGIGVRLADCLERGFLENRDLKFVDDCYRKVVEEEEQKVQKLYSLARSFMEFSLKGMFLAPVGFGLMILADVKKGMTEILKEDYELVNKEIKKKVKELVLGTADDEERDLKIRKFAYDKLGFWSEVSDLSHADTARDKIHAFLLKEKLSEILHKTEVWKLVIERIAKEQTYAITDGDVREKVLNRLSAAVKRGETDVANTILDNLQKAVEETEFSNKGFKRQLLKSLRDLREEINQPALKKLVDYNRLKSTEVYRLLTQSFERLKEGERNAISSALRKSLFEITLKDLEKELPKRERELKETLLNAVDNAKTPLELTQELRKAKFHLGEDRSVKVGDLVYEKVKDELLREYDKLKKQTLIVESKSAALIMVFKELNREERKLLNEDKNKFLVRKFNLTENQIRQMLESGEIRHGLEYSALVDNLIEKQTVGEAKEFAQNFVRERREKEKERKRKKEEMKQFMASALSKVKQSLG